MYWIDAENTDLKGNHPKKPLQGRTATSQNTQGNREKTSHNWGYRLAAHLTNKGLIIEIYIRKTSSSQ